MKIRSHKNQNVDFSKHTLRRYSRFVRSLLLLLGLILCNVRLFYTSSPTQISSFIEEERFPAMTLRQEISDALRTHVSNNVPIRLLQVPELKLVERGEVFKQLLPKMSGITEKWVKNKIAATKWDKIEFISSNEDRRKYAIAEGISERAKYAILSHTWLLDEREFTYPDYVAQTNMSGAGYAKMKNFAEVTYRDHGMTLAWLDTLCINKDSTSELDESLRSMYRWYLNSSICIVILADTTSLAHVPKDRWFTRGWTLQELLAPRRLKFYSKNWKPIVAGHNDKEMVDDNADSEDNDDGDNTSNIKVFAPLIEQATGITPYELRNFDPDATRRNIPTRMMWASRRQTTREEDASYCLMGVFGVSFSIAYGEGRERAFFRLLEAILTSFSDILAVLDWAGKPIGRGVHATSLLPSGPECYKILPGDKRLESSAWSDIQDYVPFSFAPKEPMTLTHLGLKVDLYCLPATVGSLEEFEGTYTVGLQCGAKFRDELVMVKVYPHNFKRFDADEDEGFAKEFMFGIWTFERDSEDKVYIPNEPCRAFLLESQENVQPLEMPQVWKKVDTVEPIRFSPDSPWDSDWDLDEISMRTFIL